jgi:site-specific DNA-methyltransferase (adenine-specific)
MPGLDAESVDAIVTDPPYGLAFMGKAWDHAVPGPEFFAAMLRVAKPGAHLVAFGGTRLYHRMTCAMEDAGWEIRDCLMWLYGSGFPKSHDVSKAIDREAGAEREVVNTIPDRWAGKGQVLCRSSQAEAESVNITTPATDGAKRWQGWGTALKPAWEPIVLARKPLDGTVAQNHLRHGCGGVNVDGCRVGTDVVGWSGGGGGEGGTWNEESCGLRKSGEPRPVAGRWPANLVLDAEAGAVLDGQVGDRPGFSTQRDLTTRNGTDGTLAYGKGIGQIAEPGVRLGFNDSGGASRFFYCPKADGSDRNDGLDTNHHPTVKPTDLMRWLVRLVTPEHGLVLDPFTGSGSTGRACVLEGRRFLGIEREAEYVAIARARIEGARETVGLFAG